MFNLTTLKPTNKNNFVGKIPFLRLLWQGFYFESHDAPCSGSGRLPWRSAVTRREACVCFAACPSPAAAAALAAGEELSAEQVEFLRSGPSAGTREAATHARPPRGWCDFSRLWDSHVQPPSMTSVWKRLQRVGKKASKFQFAASFQELMVECTKKWSVTFCCCCLFSVCLYNWQEVLPNCSHTH